MGNKIWPINKLAKKFKLPSRKCQFDFKITFREKIHVLLSYVYEKKPLLQQKYTFKINHKSSCKWLTLTNFRKTKVETPEPN